MFIAKKIKNKIFGIGLCIVGLFLLATSNAQAATLQISSDSATFTPGETMTLYVVLNSEGVAINNAEAVISFPADMIEVLSVSKGSSIFSLWVEEPNFSNATGKINFNGGVPTPGFSGARGVVVSIVVRAKKAGDAKFVFSGASVLANDGLGTNVLNGQFSKTLVISPKEEPAVEPDKPDEADLTPSEAAGSLALRISSVTHPDQEQWYKDKNPNLSWLIPARADAIRLGVSDNSLSSPQVLYRPAVNRRVLSDLADGTWYFKAQARRDGTWGPISTYVVRIDTIAPQLNKAEFTYDDSNQTLNIATEVTDFGSGLEYYEIWINNLLVKSVPADQFIAGQYRLPTAALGESTVKLLAFDRAANSVEASGRFFGVPATPVAPVVAPFTFYLDKLSALISNRYPLVISGRVPQADLDLRLYFKRSDGELIVVDAKSGLEGNLSVLAPRLHPGNYDIWAEIVWTDKMISSGHIYTRVSASQLINLGPFTISLASTATSILILMAMLMFAAYYLGRRRSKVARQSIKTAISRPDYRPLIMIKKRFDKHLTLLQRIRRDRLLTNDEKEIKAEIESALDQIDYYINKQKAKNSLPGPVDTINLVPTARSVKARNYSKTLSASKTGRTKK